MGPSATNGVEQVSSRALVAEEDSGVFGPFLEPSILLPRAVAVNAYTIKGGRGRTLESRQLKFGTQMGSNGLLYMDIPEEEEEEEFSPEEDEEDEEEEEEEEEVLAALVKT